MEKQKWIIAKIFASIVGLIVLLVVCYFSGVFESLKTIFNYYF